MRVWDISPAYLNRQSLLGEHRELHGLFSILVHGKKGYSRHPETVRWIGCLSGLARRHAWLVAEMHLRGYAHHSPVPDSYDSIQWPTVYVTRPVEQFSLLKAKYHDRPNGRIALPSNAQILWAQHKYSVMARDPATYRSIGKRIACMKHNTDYAALTNELITILQQTPHPGRLHSALEHMWGHVSAQATSEERHVASNSASTMFGKTSELAVRLHDPYLMASTALSELAPFIEEK